MSAEPDDVASAVYTGSQLLTLRGALVTADELLSRESFVETFDIGLTAGQLDTIRDLITRLGGIIDDESPTPDEDVTVNMTLFQAQAIRDTAMAIEELAGSNAGRNLLEDIGLNPRSLERDELVEIRTATPAPPEDMIDQLRRGESGRGPGGRDTPDTDPIVTDMGVPEKGDIPRDFRTDDEGNLVLIDGVDPLAEAIESDVAIESELDPIRRTAERLRSSADAEEPFEGVMSHRRGISELATDGDPPRCLDIISAMVDCVEFSIRGNHLPGDDRIEIVKAYRDLMDGLIDLARRRDCLPVSETAKIGDAWVEYTNRLSNRNGIEAVVASGQGALRAIAAAKAGYVQRTRGDVSGTDRGPGSDAMSSAAEKLVNMDPQTGEQSYIRAVDDATFQSISQSLAAFESVDVSSEPADVLLVDLGTIVRKAGLISGLANDDSREELIDRVVPLWNAYRAELRSMGVIEGEMGGMIDDAANDLFRGVRRGQTNLLVVHQVIDGLAEAAREEGV